MKKFICVLISALTALLCSLTVFAESVLYAAPATGETPIKIYVLLGLMGAAIAAIIILLIVRRKNSGSEQKKENSQNQQNK